MRTKTLLPILAPLLAATAASTNPLSAAAPATAGIAVAGPPVHVGSLMGDTLAEMVSQAATIKCYASPCNMDLFPVMDWIPQRPDPTNGNRLTKGDLRVGVQGRWARIETRNALIRMLAKAAQQAATGEGHRNCWDQPYVDDSGADVSMRMCSTGRYFHAEYRNDGESAPMSLEFIRVELGPTDKGRAEKDLACGFFGESWNETEVFRDTLRDAGLRVPREVTVGCCQENEPCLKIPFNPPE